MRQEKSLLKEPGKEPITLQPPSIPALIYVVYRLCGSWAHPWMAVGGWWGLIREAIATLSPFKEASYDWIIVNANNETVGMVMIDRIDRQQKTGRLSYAIFPEHQKRGYASRAARFAVSYGYDQLGLNELRTCVLRENAASNKILDSLGFQRDPSQSSPYVEGGIAYKQDCGVIPRPTT